MPPRYGLYGAGAAGRGLMSEIPCLRKELGPVAASTPKVAARIAHSLNSGHAVRDLSELNECKVILICAPGGGAIERVVAAFREAPIDWHSKSVLFCFSEVASMDHLLFQDRGASMGSINKMEGFERLFVVEGGRNALREAKRLAKELKGKTVEVAQEKVRLFEAARTLSGSLFTPLVNCCAEWIRQSGVESKDAAYVAERMLLWTLRSYLHSGRRGWAGAAAKRDWTSVEKQYRAVRKLNRVEAEYFRSTAEHAFAMYESYPELARYLLKKVEE
jgi:hypothetical protein